MIHCVQTVGFSEHLGIMTATLKKTSPHTKPVSYHLLATIKPLHKLTKIKIEMSLSQIPK